MGVLTSRSPPSLNRVHSVLSLPFFLPRVLPLGSVPSLSPFPSPPWPPRLPLLSFPDASSPLAPPRSSHCPGHVGAPPDLSLICLVLHSAAWPGGGPLGWSWGPGEGDRGSSQSLFPHELWAGGVAGGPAGTGDGYSGGCWGLRPPCPGKRSGPVSDEGWVHLGGQREEEA